MTNYFIGKMARIIETNWEFIISGVEHRTSYTGRDEFSFYGKDTGSYPEEELFIYDARIHRRIEELKSRTNGDLSVWPEIDFLESLTK